jgi:hypothetical protein
MASNYGGGAVDSLQVTVVEWFPGVCSVNACGVQEQIRVEKEKFAQARAAVEQELSTLSSQLQVAGVVQRLP